MSLGLFGSNAVKGIGVVIASLVASLAEPTGVHAASTGEQQSEFSERECFGLHMKYSFVAERWKEPFYSARYPLPFNFANSFYFDLSDEVRPRAAYATISLDSENATLQVRFLSANDTQISLADFQRAKVLECGTKRSTVSVFRTLGGGDLVGGNDYRITVSFTRLDEKIRVETDIEETARLLIFSATNRRHYWAEFSQYALSLKSR